MQIVAATIYWIIVSIWAVVLLFAVYNYFINRIIFGASRLLIIVVMIDTIRNIVENVYFGVYFGSQYGIFDRAAASVLGKPILLLLPKVMNVGAGCTVLFILFLHWLPRAARERKTLGRLATIDGMTGLVNRRQFLILSEAECERCNRYGRPLSLLMVDIDHFKSVNDRFGHDVGDKVIIQIAAYCQQSARETDLAARLGGEEFCVLLPETTASDAETIAERLRAVVADSPVMLDDGELQVSVSIGISDYESGATLADFMKRADLALYDAKRSGRNRVCTFSRA